MATKTISTFNGVTQTAGPATSLIVSSNSLPTVLAIKGYCNGTGNTQYFLQFFNSATVPANTAVPLLSLQVLGVDGFIFNDKPTGWDAAQLVKATPSRYPVMVAANGLIACLSTTEATLTIGTGNVTMDLAVEVDSTEVPIDSESISQGQNVQSLIVVPDGTERKLTRFTATNKGAATEYLMLFGYTTPATGALPVQQWKVTAGQTISPTLGNGFFVLQGSPTTYVIHNGIYLYASSTTQTFSPTLTNWDITAAYSA